MTEYICIVTDAQDTKESTRTTSTDSTTDQITYPGTDKTTTNMTYTYTFPDCTCPACRGDGYQENNDGIIVECPLCNGTGRWQKKTGYQYPQYSVWDDPTLSTYYQNHIITLC